MIYFTRALHDGSQDHSGRSRRACKRSRMMSDLYAKHVKSVGRYLPARWVRIFDGSLHDARIVKIRRAGEGLLIHLDCKGTWGRYGGCRIALRFIRVSSAQVDKVKPGDWWLYNEVYLGSRGKARVCVLLQDTEMDIEADSCRVHEIER